MYDRDTRGQKFVKLLKNFLKILQAYSWVSNQPIKKAGKSIEFGKGLNLRNSRLLPLEINMLEIMNNSLKSL